MSRGAPDPVGYPVDVVDEVRIRIGSLVRVLVQRLQTVTKKQKFFSCCWQPCSLLFRDVSVLGETVWADSKNLLASLVRCGKLSNHATGILHLRIPYGSGCYISGSRSGSESENSGSGVALFLDFCGMAVKLYLVLSFIMVYIIMSVTVFLYGECYVIVWGMNRQWIHNHILVMSFYTFWFSWCRTYNFLLITDNMLFVWVYKARWIVFYTIWFWERCSIP